MDDPDPPAAAPVEPLSRVEAGEARPFPLEDLERLMRGTTRATLARDLRLHHRQLLRLRHSGLTVDQADELAVRAGFHPAEVWPDWFAVAAATAPAPKPRRRGLQSRRSASRRGRAIALRRQGLTMAAIAAELGVSRAAVCVYLRDVDAEDLPAKVCTRRGVLTAATHVKDKAERRRRVLELWRSGLTRPQVARALGTSPTVVNTILARHAPGGRSGLLGRASGDDAVA